MVFLFFFFLLIPIPMLGAPEIKIPSAQQLRTKCAASTQNGVFRSTYAINLFDCICRSTVCIFQAFFLFRVALVDKTPSFD